MQKLLKYLPLLVLPILFYTSCKKEQFNLDPNAELVVRQDTLWFDTVFTKFYSTRPKSVNKQIVIVNPHKDKIKTSIRLAGGQGSHFRMNVDGEPGFSFNDIEIFPKDSIFIFIEVHPDKNNNSPDFNPLIIRDSVLFYTNGNEQKVNLIGWGQDAHYFLRDSLTQDTTWSNTALPIVIYGYLYVKPGVKLTIEKGMQVHFAPYSWLFVEGEVDIQGSCDEPVLMQGDRLEPDWEEIPGQWGGIWINYPSKGNSIEHAVIKNGTVGVYCDTISGDNNLSPNVTINKSFIRNMLYDGIAGRYSNIRIRNTISANCGRYTFLASFGGKYDIRHCSFHTGGMNFSRQDPTFAILNRNRDEFGFILGTYDLDFTLFNSIISGNQEFEVGVDIENSKASLVIQGNLAKTPLFPASVNHTYQDPLFVDPGKFNYQLDTLSPAIDLSTPVGITDDFCDQPRDANPDVGAFEFQN